MNRAIPEFLGIPAPAVTCWTAAHADLHWANLTASPLRLLDWEGWGQAPRGSDCAALYASTLLQPNVAARVLAVFPILGSPAGLAAEATVCAQLLQTVARGDNLTGRRGRCSALPSRTTPQRSLTGRQPMRHLMKSRMGTQGATRPRRARRAHDQVWLWRGGSSRRAAGSSSMPRCRYQASAQRRTTPRRKRHWSQSWERTSSQKSSLSCASTSSSG